MFKLNTQPGFALKILLVYLFSPLLSSLAMIGLASGDTSFGGGKSAALSSVEQLGQQIFFDTNLSSPAGQSCASCHDPNTAFTEPAIGTPVSNGVVPGHTGTRNTPSIVYSIFSPAFHLDSQELIYIGGQFLDGRASNLSEQAKKPFLNPDEMNNASETEVVNKLGTASYAGLFRQIYGGNALDNVGQAYEYMANAIAAFENTAIFNRFTSKYDYYLAGEVEFTDDEKWGLKLFNDERKGNCAACHPSESDTDLPPLFTDFSYDNLGIPSNPVILSHKGSNFVDLGLGSELNNPRENGKFKVPSLRNVAKTSPYMHNGVFEKLRDAVEFYSTRDTNPKWGAPEVRANVNKEELGDLELTDAEIDAIVTFLKTLTDGYIPNDTVNHLNNSGLVTLPLVRIEGAAIKTVMMSAKLKKDITQPNVYRLLYAEEAKATNINLRSLPSYSVDNDYLEIPTIKVDGNPDYIARLKRIPNKTDYLFELTYAKALQ